MGDYFYFGIVIKHLRRIIFSLLRFKIDVLGTNQGRHPVDVFPDVLSTSLGRFSKTGRITTSLLVFHAPPLVK